jgi:hypothetical protein
MFPGVLNICQLSGLRKIFPQGLQILADLQKNDGLEHDAFLVSFNVSLLKIGKRRSHGV